MAIDYLASAKQQFAAYKRMGEKAINQIEDAALHWQPNEDTNSIATIINHLWGNMRSRWTDFLTTDGEKPGRDRDSEFEHKTETREELMAKWDAGWKCLTDTLDSLTESDLERTIYIRNDGMSALAAINRQLCHYSYHVGQIVFAAKQLKSQPWDTLSIPRNQSITYNENKFAQPKQERDYTAEQENQKSKTQGSHGTQ